VIALEDTTLRNGSTSASGPMAAPDVPVSRLLGLWHALVVGTSAGTAVAAEAFSSTSAGSALPVDPRPGTAISELRRLSGLTWRELAHVFRVSRRTLHFWASGEQMSVPHHERLVRLVTFLRRVDRGWGKENGALFRLPDERGSSPLDFLAAGEFERAFSMLGPGSGAPRPSPRPLGDETREARKPLPPDVLADARHETVHTDSGRRRPAKRTRVKRGRA